MSRGLALSLESSWQKIILAAMPTVLRVGPYRFFFYASDRPEPRHVHVERDQANAKFWLGPPATLQRSNGFSRSELNTIYRLIEEHHDLFSRSWDEYFA